MKLTLLVLVFVLGCPAPDHTQSSSDSVGALTCAQAQEIYDSCEDLDCNARYGAAVRYLCDLKETRCE